MPQLPANTPEGYVRVIPGALAAAMGLARASGRDLAEAAMCSPSYISALRNGTRDICSDRIAGRIAEFLGVSPDMLYDLEAPAA